MTRECVRALSAPYRTPRRRSPFETPVAATITSIGARSSIEKIRSMSAIPSSRARSISLRVVGHKSRPRPIPGSEGIPVESYVKLNDRIDVNTVAMEFSFILSQVRKAGDSLQVGSLEELSVKAQRLMLVCRMISPQYFVAIAMTPEANFGKARFLARLAQPTLVAQL